MAILKFTNGQLCDEGEFYTADLYVDDVLGVIVEPTENVDEVVDLQGQVLTPGFIDFQINGCFNFDFSHLRPEDEFIQGYKECLRKLLETGTTSLCPTMVTSTPRNYSTILKWLGPERVNDHSESLGAHCEGPIISKMKKGCHEVRNLRSPSTETEFYDVYGGEENFKYMKILTAAPELPGFLDLIPHITAHNVIYSIGHTMTTFDTAYEAVKRGASMITHMFNAMPQPHHRNPGPIGLEGLENEAECPYFGLISDGIHIHPSYINIIYNANKDRCCLVTDATNLLGMPDATYPWEDQLIVKKGSSIKLKGTDTICGSVTTQAHCLRNFMKWAHIGLPEALKTVTNHPAIATKTDDHKGFLRVGYDADLCIVDAAGNVHSVYKLGNKIR